MTTPKNRPFSALIPDPGTTPLSRPMNRLEIAVDFPSFSRTLATPNRTPLEDNPLLWVDSVDQPRERYRVPYMVEFTDPGDNSFQAESETRMRNAAKLSQIQIPLVAFRVYSLFTNPCQQRTIILNPLPSTDNLPITFCTHTYREQCNFLILAFRHAI